MGNFHGGKLSNPTILQRWTYLAWSSDVTTIQFTSSYAFLLGGGFVS
jgi:hypothetical protein